MLKFSSKVRCQRRIKIPITEGGNGFITRPGSAFEGTVVVEVDTEAIVKELGEKAVYSKSGKAKYLRGAIVVRHLRNPGDGPPSPYEEEVE